MADLTFLITKKSPTKAEGTLAWPAKNLNTKAVSGPYGNGALPTGTYEAPRAKLLDKSDPAYVDKKGKGWMQAFKEPNFSGRTGLGVHPDGNVPGTEGCIGLDPTDTRAWYDAFYASTSPLRVEVKESPGLLIVAEAESGSGLRESEAMAAAPGRPGDGGRMALTIRAAVVHNIGVVSGFPDDMVTESKKLRRDLYMTGTQRESLAPGFQRIARMFDRNAIVERSDCGDLETVKDAVTLVAKASGKPTDTPMDQDAYGRASFREVPDDA